MAVAIAACLAVGFSDESRANPEHHSIDDEARDSSKTLASDRVSEVAATAAAPPPINKSSDIVLQVTRTGHLVQLFDGLNYSYLQARDRNVPVPRLLVEQLPNDILHINSCDMQRSVFLNTLLPIVLRVNEDITSDRERLIRLRNRFQARMPISGEDYVWLTDLRVTYQVTASSDHLSAADFNRLLEKVDIIPPSMALAQSAVESGWGRSVLARRSNAIFGQIAATNNPATFDQLIDAAAAYALNLNTNIAYADFRRLRAIARQQGHQPDGYYLLGGLTHYSELGGGYISYIRQVILSNNLGRIDRAHLVVANSDS
jgi:Bax protein